MKPNNVWRFFPLIFWLSLFKLWINHKFQNNKNIFKSGNTARHSTILLRWLKTLFFYKSRILPERVYLNNPEPFRHMHAISPELWLVCATFLLNNDLVAWSKAYSIKRVFLVVTFIAAAAGDTEVVYGDWHNFSLWKHESQSYHDSSHYY